MPCRRCEDSVHTSHQVGVADAVGEQAGHADDVPAVARDGDVLRLLERPPQRCGRPAVVEPVGREVGLGPDPVDAFQGAVDLH